MKTILRDKFPRVPARKTKGTQRFNDNIISILGRKGRIRLSLDSLTNEFENFIFSQTHCPKYSSARRTKPSGTKSKNVFLFVVVKHSPTSPSVRNRSSPSVRRISTMTNSPSVRRTRIYSTNERNTCVYKDRNVNKPLSSCVVITRARCVCTVCCAVVPVCVQVLGASRNKSKK